MKLNRAILISLLINTMTISAQEKPMCYLGSNLPPIIGNTFTLNAELIFPQNFTSNFEVGIMMNSKLQGSFTKIGTGTSDHINSGQYFSTGLRFTPRKKLNHTYFFIGIKILGGYFKQSAEMWDNFEMFFKDGLIPPDYVIIGDRVYSKGYYVGLAGDMGLNFKVTNRFNLELGIQGGHHLYTSKRQVDYVNSYLPGMGSLNVVGIVRTKLLIGKLRNYSC